MSLSVVMVTRDVDNIIEGALKSVEGLWDELIIVDSGSTDKTVAVVKKFTKQVFLFPFRGDFSEMRNFGLSKAKSEWVLVIDTDERLSGELRKQISHFVKHKDIDGYWFRRRTYISPSRYLRYGLFYPDYQLRLFRCRKEYRYRGAIHEQLTIPKEKTKEVPYDILHYPQHPKYTSFHDFRNFFPYIDIHAKELEESSESALQLLWEGLKQAIMLFGGGFFRGRGFLDSLAGLRAHLLFMSSILLAYTRASWKKLTRRYEVHSV